MNMDAEEPCPIKSYFEVDINTLNTWKKEALGAVPQLFRFGIVGITATSFYFLFSVLSVSFFGFDPRIINPTAVTLSAMLSYLGHHYITFRHKGRHRESLPKFIIQLIMAYVITQLILHVILTLQLSYIVALIINTVTMPMGSFMFMKFYVFANKSRFP
ncbi:MAG: hypothetical protein A3G13_01880 [Candidatus Levybacteria bacterium RIFCSPLOWO2_12_FULL_37_7]|nr:MAG: hypothetical protein A3G13_01880 [Candidatus Levybacteria bacterium RIFCSPLOWO2_12_FULL_37_7]